VNELKFPPTELLNDQTVQPTISVVKHSLLTQRAWHMLEVREFFLSDTKSQRKCYLDPLGTCLSNLYSYYIVAIIQLSPRNFWVPTKEFISTHFLL